jgi:hypothetical protein
VAVENAEHQEFGEFMIFADFAAISSPLPKEFDSPLTR